VAGNARKDIENITGKPVITPQNAIDFSQLISNLIEDSNNKDETPE